MSTVGKRLLSAVVASADTELLISLQLFPELFREGEVPLYEFIVEHVSTHGSIPHQDTVESKLGDILTEVLEPASYYMAEVTKRYLHTKLKVATLALQDQLQASNPEAALTLVTDLVTELYATKHRQRMFDFRDAADLVYAEYMKKHTMAEETGIMLGWPSIDNVSSGLQPGDYCTVNGRPAAGKTMALLKCALHPWQKGLSAPLFVSMEMGMPIIRSRLASMDAKKALTHVMKGTLSSKGFTLMMTKLEENKAMPKPFWVVDGNLTSTADDIIRIARQTKPSAVYIDGAYLLRHPNQKMNKFERMGENAERLKTTLAGDLGIPVMASYQLNREVMKKNKKAGEEPGVEDIYGNDAMGQLSTLALGFFEAESIETLKRRKCTIMKGRNGEVGEFFTNWNFVSMDFDEIIEVPKEKMQFLG